MNNFDVKLHSCHTGLQSHGGEQLLPLFSYGMEALLLSTYLRIQIDAHSLTILSLPNKRHDLLLSTTVSCSDIGEEETTLSTETVTTSRYTTEVMTTVSQSSQQQPQIVPDIVLYVWLACSPLMLLVLIIMMITLCTVLGRLNR